MLQRDGSTFLPSHLRVRAFLKDMLPFEQCHVVCVTCLLINLCVCVCACVRVCVCVCVCWGGVFHKGWLVTAFVGLGGCHKS